MTEHEPELVQELERFRRNRSENEICELWDRVRALEEKNRKIEMEIRQFEGRYSIEACKRRTDK